MRTLAIVLSALLCSSALAAEWQTLPQIDSPDSREDPSAIDHLLPEGAGGIYIPPPGQPKLVGSFRFSSTFQGKTGWEIQESKKADGTYRLLVEIGEKAWEPKAKPHSYGIPLAPLTVQAIREIWTNVIRDTRIGPEYLAPDITGFRFEILDPAFGLISGSTTAATEGKPPGLIVDAGRAVLGYAESKDRDENALREKLTAIRATLIEYYKKR